jgi:hypothetical protein
LETQELVVLLDSYKRERERNLLFSLVSLMDTKTITHKMEWVMAVGNARADGISSVAREREGGSESESESESHCFL